MVEKNQDLVKENLDLKEVVEKDVKEDIEKVHILVKEDLDLERELEKEVEEVDLECNQDQI
tara:strand:+ start:100 stop:282 length:183 start_codon:yes stop_codon:yes gene_type:complete